MTNLPTKSEECICFAQKPCACGGCGGSWSCDDSCSHCSPTQPELPRPKKRKLINIKAFTKLASKITQPEMGEWEDELLDLVGIANHTRPGQVTHKISDIKEKILMSLAKQKEELERHQLYERAAIESSWMQRETVWKAELKIKVEGMIRGVTKHKKHDKEFYVSTCKACANTYEQYNRAITRVLEVIK